MLKMNQILLSDNPLDILRDDQWLSKNFKELLDLKSFDKGHKDNFQHTLRVLENVMDETQDIRLYYVALFHDLGKYKTKRYTTGGWVFHGHETVSARMLKPIYDRFKLDPSTFQFVYNIVRYHGETRNVFGENSTDSAIRRLYKNLIFNIDGADYQEIVNAFALFSKCDLTTKNEKLREEVVKNADTFLKRLEEILIDDDKKQKRYALNGNDIMETFNVKPGKDLGMVLKYIKVSVDSGKLPDDKKVLIDHVRETFFSKLF
jgi:hypothetical protein